MPIPSSGPIKFSELQTEFGGTDPVGLGEYYAGGSFVAAGTTGDSGSIPTSGTIRAGNFYGSAAAGILWGSRYLRLIRGSGKIRYINNRFIFGSQGNNDTLILSTSTDGSNWTEIKATLTNPTENNSVYNLLDIAWSGSLYVAVVQVQLSNNSLIYRIFTSTNLNTWTKTYDIPNNTNSWITESITYGNGRFVFFSHSNASTTTNTVYTSTDGTNWTSGLVAGFTSSAHCSKDIIWNGFVFVAVGQARNIAYSTNGTTWSVASTGGSGTFNSIAWGNNIFVAFLDGFSFVLTSPNGVTWTQRNLPSGSTGTSVVWAGSLFVTSPGTLKTWATSPDGITWTGRSYTNLYPVTERPTTSLAAGGGRVVGVNSYTLSPSQLVAGALIVSSDAGVSWTSPYNGTLANLTAIEGNGTITVIAGYTDFNAAGIRQTVILSSYDGINWTKRDIAGTGNMATEIIWTGTRFVLGVGDSTGGIYNNGGLLASSDGVNWSVIIPYANSTLPIFSCVDMVWNGSKIIAVGSQGGTYHSSDGLNWNRYELSSSSLRFFYCTWGANKFIASNGATIYESSNGETWTTLSTLPKINTTLTFNMYKLRYLNNKFIAVGYATISSVTTPVVLSSSDGITWTRATLSTTQAGIFTDVTSFGTKLYANLSSTPVTATIRNSTVYTSSDGGLNWSPIEATNLKNLGNGYWINGASINRNRIKRVGNKIFSIGDFGIINVSSPPTTTTV